MATKNDKLKAKKDKAKAKKDKMKAKMGAKKQKCKGCSYGIIAVTLLSLVLAGCMGTNPASRQTNNTEGDSEVAVTVKGSNNCTINARINHGDGAYASADSEGSTETQTATPTLDVRTRIDARYNDVLASASTASRSVLGAIGDGITGVLDLMQSGKSGKVAVTKTDGSQGCVECHDGQCSWGSCSDD